MFTETTMRVLACIIDGLAVIISVVMVVSVSIVIITKHGVLAVTIVVAMSVSVHHRRRHGWSPIITARISWVWSLALHRHCILRVIVIHRGIWIISSTTSPTWSVSIHLRRSRGVLILKRLALISLLLCTRKSIASSPFRSPSWVVAVVVDDGDRSFHSAVALAADSSSASVVALA